MGLCYRTWNKVFKSRFLKGLESQLIYYFYVLVSFLNKSGGTTRLMLTGQQVAILILFFLDAIREMQKYNNEEQQFQNSRGASHLDIQMQTVQTIWWALLDQSNEPFPRT